MSRYRIRRVLLGGVVSLSAVLGGAMHAQASNVWYGVVNVKKVIDQPKVKKPLEPINDDFPSYEITREIKVWNGTLRLLPSNKAVSSLSYRGERAYQRTTSKQIECLTGRKGTYRDTEKQFSKMSGAGVFESAEPFTMPLNPDGSYGGMVFVHSDGIANAVMRMRSDRDTFNSCHKDPHTKKDDDSGPVPAIVVGLAVPITGQAEPDAMEIKGAGEWRDEEEGSVMTASWVLTRKAPKIRAVIQGPKKFERAATITLDGSKSTGRIEKYIWEFDIDEDCTSREWNNPMTVNKKSVTFRALCNFSAYLTVEGEDSSDSTSLALEVEPRKGRDWKTLFDTRPGKHLDSLMFRESMHLGVNQCALHNSEEATGHYIHNEIPNAWENVGYQLAKVEDDGPFKGLYYVKSQKLRVSRVERVNVHLLPGGRVYDLNQTLNNLGAVNALAAQVKAHEKVHSTLLALALKELGEEGDPAARVESVVELDEADAIESANAIVGEANAFLGQATSEENVRPQLYKQGFTKRVSVWFLVLGNRLPQKPKDMGILSDVGDRETENKTDEDNKTK